MVLCEFKGLVVRLVVILMALGLFACGGGAASGGASSSIPGSSLSSGSKSFSSAISSVAWSEQYLIEASGASEVTDLLVAPDNQLYVAGYINGVVNQTDIIPAGNAKGVIYQLAAAEVMSESNAAYQLDTAATDVIEALAFNAHDQSVYFSGRTSGAVAGQVNFGQFDVVFGALRASVSELIQLGSAAPQHPVAMHFTPDNDVVIAGYDDVYIPSNYVEAWRDPFLTLLTPWGAAYTRAWEIRYSSVAEDDLRDLAVAPAHWDQLVAVGHVYNGAQRGPFVASYDSDASVLWRQRFELYGLDNLAAVVISAEGRVWVGGTGQIATPPLAASGRDFVVYELDAQTGEVVSSQSYGTDGDDQLTAMALDAGGNLYLAGELSIAASEEGQVLQEALLIKVSPAGAEVMRKRWTSPTGLLAVSSIAVNQQERVFVGGYTRAADGSRHQGIVFSVDARQ